MKQTNLPLVNSLHENVKRWQDQGYPDITSQSIRLLDFWFREDHDLTDGTEFKFHNAQKEAIETLIYCYEVLKSRSLYELAQQLDVTIPIDPRTDKWPKYAFKMATGSGKTMVMALAIVWAYFNGFSKHFLVIAPNLIVLDRLAKDFIDGKVFRDFPLVPPEWKDK